MNPEFRRNIWLELAPRRIIFMIAVLALIFFAAGMSGKTNPAASARILYYLIVVVWGARNAGLSVAGEIRDHTWDSQRLSSISAAEMTWGKLFGSTIYNWFGGGICLFVAFVFGVAHGGILSALIDLIYLVAIGVIAQSASLLASLVAVRRRQQHSRFEVFLYQLAGIVAASAASYVWAAADPAGALLIGRKTTDVIAWWGAAREARPFLLVSLLSFAGWVLLACYRSMRRELKLRNGPFVWLVFLAFTGLYVAGFDAWLTQDVAMRSWNVVALRLALAATAFAALTYLTVLLEPKDRVLYRWYGHQIAAGHIGLALWSLQAWIMSFFATVVTTLALLSSLPSDQESGRVLIVSGLGFLTRDIAIFVLFSTFSVRRSADFSAVIVLFALYVVLPAILTGLGLTGLLPFFHPVQTVPGWVAPVVIWAEAIVVLIVTATRLALSEQRQN